MSYVVLARKYRPRHFAEMVGQEHVVQALGNALTQQRLHHAYLFTGTRGVGKTTVSRILAKSLNCVGADGQGGITAQPCGVCQACRDIDAGRFVDYTELDAASNRGVDEVQGLLEQAVYKPVQGRFKVFMIDEVHMLTNTAFNAMLKTLEEPPEYLKFVLATTDPQKVPVTVLSRCLQFNLRPMAPETVHAHLVTVLGQEAIAADEGALRLLARAARGSMRDALSLTDQAIAFGGGSLSESTVRQMLGAVDRGHVLSLIEALAHGDGARVVQGVKQLRLQGLSAASTLEEMTLVLQRMAVHQMADAGELSDPDAQEEARLAAVMPPDETQLLYSLCLHGRAELGLAPDEYAALTMVLLRLLAFKPAAAAEKKNLKSPEARPVAESASAPKPVPTAAAVNPAAPAPPPVPVAQAQAQAQPPAVSAPERVPVPVVKPDAAGAVAETPTAPAASVATAPMLPQDDEETPWIPDDGMELDDVPPWESLPTTQAVVAVPVREQPFPSAALATSTHTPAQPTTIALVPTPLGDFWFETVQALVKADAISALNRELALQSELVARDGSVWRLRTERQTLNQASTRERLTQALRGAGLDVTLQVETAQAMDTPALRLAAQAAAAQQEAEAIIMNDPFVQRMMREFGGKIVPGTLKASVVSSE
jgi:DNA polymerase-3 subunit gamma/tau